MRPCSPPLRLLPLLATLLGVGAACSPAIHNAGSGMRAEEAEEAEEPTGAPLFLGLRLGAPRARIEAQLPGLRFERPDGQGGLGGEAEAVREEVRLRLVVSIFEGRLASVSGSSVVAGVESFERLARALEAELGPGDRMLCQGEGGEPLAAYLASGHGSLHASWTSPELRARLDLSPTSDGRLLLHAHALWLPLTLRQPMDLKPGLEQEPRPKRIRAPTGGADRRPPPSACPEAGPSPPRFEGFPFGASLEEATRQLRREAPSLRVERDRLILPYALEGVPGELTLSFYEGCFAAVFFEAEGREEGYRALQRGLAARLGAEGRSERCSPSGAPPTAAEIAALRGSLHTTWAGPPIRGDLRLSTSDPRRPPRTIAELTFLPLESRRPQIDFD